MFISPEIPNRNSHNAAKTPREFREVSTFCRGQLCGLAMFRGISAGVTLLAKRCRKWTRGPLPADWSI